MGEEHKSEVSILDKEESEDSVDWGHGSEVGASDAESNADRPPPENMPACFDIRVLRDASRFNEMGASWKYEGKYQFLDLDQADGEISYLSRKVVELKGELVKLDDDVKGQVDRHDTAESKRQKTVKRIEDLKAEIAKLEGEVEEDEQDKCESKKKDAEIMHEFASTKASTTACTESPRSKFACTGSRLGPHSIDQVRGAI